MPNNLTLGSLFDGLGGWLLAATGCGIKPVWSSEIDEFPMAVSRYHFPDVEQLGDIKKINGADIEPVDIICVGSPCQDLSVAGKRAGLAGERSGLFGEAIRIIREMREATNGEYPKWFVWENVCGVFSSNKGNDFRTVLEEITETEIPMPQSGKWARAGLVRSPKCDVAWRVLDARYWGVPQRRKRVFLVADFRAERRPEVLFEPESVSWNSQQGREQGQETSGDIGESPKETSRTVCIEGNGTRASHMGDGYKDSDVMYTLNTVEKHAVCIEDKSIIGVDGYNSTTTGDVVSTLRTNCGDGIASNGVMCKTYGFEPGITSRDGRNLSENLSTTLRANMGDNQEAVVYGVCSAASNSMKYSNPNSGIYEVNTTRTLYGTGGNNQPFVLKDQKCFDVRFTSEGTRNARQNCYETETSRTIDTGGNMPASNQGGVAVVAYGICSKGSHAMQSDNPHSGFYKADTARCLDANGGNPACNQGGMMVCQGVATQSYSELKLSDKGAALRASGGAYGGGAVRTMPSAELRQYNNRVIGSLCVCDYKGVGNQYVGDGKLVIEEK